MSVAIRQGYHVGCSEFDRVDELLKLESQGIINLKKEEWQTCKKCLSPNLVDESFRREGSTICSICGKIIQYSKNSSLHYKVTGVNFNTIIKICNQKLIEAMGNANCLYDKDQRNWICSYNQKKVPIFASQISSYNQYVAESQESSWLCILIDWEKERRIVNHYNRIHFMKFEDILYDRTDLGEAIVEVATDFALNPALGLADRFDTFVKSMKPTDFERRFIDQFINGVREKTELLKRFLNFLSARKNTIVNSKVILIGGPGNPDFATIDLLDYLQEGLKPSKIGEAKRYCRSTQFTVDDFGKAQAHAIGSDTVSIVSTNKIQPEVWRLVLATRDKEGYFKHVIIEKDTILLLMNVLKLDNLFFQF
jgi:hypothetical protein